MPTRVQSVERAAAILRVLAEQSQPTSLAHLTTALGLAKGTIHGLVQTLRDVGFVEQDPESGLYALGPTLLTLGLPSLDPNELRSRALNWTDALAARAGEAVLVATFDGRDLLVVHHVFRPDSSAQVLQTGTTKPLHATALGKILLAQDPVVLRSLVGRELESHTYRTITDPARLRHELADTRDRGWAEAVEELEPGLVDLAAPIRDRTGRVVAAVGVEGAVDRLCDSRYRPLASVTRQVVAAGRSISRELGHGRA